MLPHWTQDDIITNGVRLHYYRTGRGDKRPLVLVHGFSDNGLCWTPVARELESEYDVIMPDMRAHGLSERVKPGENPDMAADLAGFIRALGLNRPIVGGHSMGSMVSYQLTVQHPDLVRALFLEDPVWWLSRPSPAWSSDGAADNPFAWVKDLPNQTLEGLLAGYNRDHPAWPEELLRPMCESKKQLDPAVLDVLSRKLRSPEVDWRTTISGVDHPLLLITANPKLGAIVTPEVVARVRELNPRVTIANVPGVGHLIRFDNHPVFMAELRKFLKRLPA